MPNRLFSPTAFPPFEREVTGVWTHSIKQPKDKRTVTVSLSKGRLMFYIEARLDSDWDDELPHTLVVDGKELETACERFRGRVKELLPPGAGYPGTAEYELRQTKLKGQLEMMALAALTECLAQHHRAE